MQERAQGFRFLLVEDFVAIAIGFIVFVVGVGAVLVIAVIVLSVPVVAVDRVGVSRAVRPPLDVAIVAAVASSFITAVISSPLCLSFMPSYARRSRCHPLH